MDFGIAGKWALVCASSKGLGKGCATALVNEGVNVVMTARGAEALEQAAAGLRALGIGEVRAVAGDITTAEGRAAALAACPQVDILVNNAGGPPPGDFRSWDREAWIKAVEANMLTPIELIKAAIDGMTARGFGRIAARNVTINNLLPGAFDTDRLLKTMEAGAQKAGITIEQAKERRSQGIPARRLGTADEFGAACAFLCSQQAGYITGQNWLLDGGAYPGTF